MNNITHICEHAYNNLAFTYIFNFLNTHKDELVIYCDLDCFPIAPFDNFIAPDNTNLNPANNWLTAEHSFSHTHYKLMGCNSHRNEKCQEFIADIWCLVNNRKFLNWHFLQLHKGSALDDTLIVQQGMFMNESMIPTFNKRTHAFHNMKIELGDNFCLPQFTPIEHYYSRERDKLNKKCEGET